MCTSAFGATRNMPVVSSRNATRASRMANACKEDALAAVGVDGVRDALDDVALGVVAFDAEPHAAVLGAHERQLHADQRDARYDELALDERPRRQIDVGLRRLGDDAALGVEHARAEHDEIDAALVARPFDRCLVVFDGDARQCLGEGVGNLARQRSERNRADQQAAGLRR